MFHVQQSRTKGHPHEPNAILTLKPESTFTSTHVTSPPSRAIPPPKSPASLSLNCTARRNLAPQNRNRQFLGPRTKRKRNATAKSQHNSKIQYTSGRGVHNLGVGRKNTAKRLFEMEIVLNIGCGLQQYSTPRPSRSRLIFVAASAFLTREQRLLGNLDERDQTHA